MYDAYFVFSRPLSLTNFCCDENNLKNIAKVAKLPSVAKKAFIQRKTLILLKKGYIQRQVLLKERLHGKKRSTW